MAPGRTLLVAIAVAGAGCEETTPPTGGDVGAAVFTVPRSGTDREPWALPFPSDVDRREPGIDLSWFPNPGRSDLVRLLVDLLGEEVDGFSTNGTLYFRFTGDIDASTLPAPAATLEADAPVFLVELESGERVPLEMRMKENATSYWSAHTLAARPVAGFPLLPARRYAAVVTRDVHTADGSAVAPSPDLEGVLGLAEGDQAVADVRDRVYGPALARLEELGTSRDRIASIAVFTTEDPVGPMLRGAEALARDVPEPDVTALFVDGRNEAYTLLTGLYGPAPLYQTGEAPFETPGSGRIDFVGGEPVVQEEAELRFALVVPNAPMPAAGFPIAITSHGTGGDYESFVEDGTAGRLAALGVASIGFDQVLHGERAPPRSDPATAFFNFLNPVAGRDNARQSALDNVQQVRLVRRMVVQGASFDPERIVFFGHSQGGLNGSLLLAIDEHVRAAVLSGTGSNIGYAILYKTDPSPILPLVELVLGLDAEAEDFDIFHPLLMALQTFIDPADPINFAARWTGHSVLLTEGLDDGFAPPIGTEALAVAARIPIVGAQSQAVPGLELLGLAPEDLPVSANVEDATAGLWQVPGRGHFAVFQDPVLSAAAPAFLASAAFAPPGTIRVP